MEDANLETTATNAENLLPENTLDLASRWDRLWASLIDTLILMVVLIPAMYVTGGFDGIAQGIEPSMAYSFIMGLFGIAIYVLVNGKLLANKGQTLGKSALKIKIVTLSGDLPSVNPHLVKRYGVYLFLGQIPFIGSFLSMINILMIFGKEKRCGHDLVAGTAVVKSQ